MNTLSFRIRRTHTWAMALLLGLAWLTMSPYAWSLDGAQDAVRERGQRPSEPRAPQSLPGGQRSQPQAPAEAPSAPRRQNEGRSRPSGPSAGAGPGPTAPPSVNRGRPPGPNWDRDRRYQHNYYYPRYGSTYRSLPSGYTRYNFRGDPYYFRGGVWYRPYSGSYAIVRPPRGLLIYTLPPFYTTLWFGGVPYYYANDVYYRWNVADRGYEVVDAPDGEPANGETVTSDELYVYPTRGQSPEQQADDRYECYRWAADQTDFDPTKPNGGSEGTSDAAGRADYRRAETACLEGRGYSVK